MLRTIAVAIGLWAFGAPAAWAQDNATATNTEHDPWLAVAALAFGLVALLAVLIFVRRDRQGTLTIASDWVASGSTILAQDVPPQLAQMGHAGVQPLTIGGPDVVLVGAPTRFLAFQNGEATDATWTSDPADALAVPDVATGRALVTARKAGAATLVARLGAASARHELTAVNPPRTAQTLPFIGAGWGSLVLGIVIASVTCALGFMGALGGEAIATILGALVGYVVAKGQSESRGSTPPPSEATKGGS